MPKGDLPAKSAILQRDEETHAITNQLERGTLS
jgi:hypothetical protein